MLCVSFHVVWRHSELLYSSVHGIKEERVLLVPPFLSELISKLQGDKV